VFVFDLALSFSLDLKRSLHRVTGTFLFPLLSTGYNNQNTFQAPKKVMVLDSAAKKSPQELHYFYHYDGSWR